MKKINSCLFLFLTPTVAFALNMLPNGHREAFMANTSASLESSPGNFIFNPGAMGFRELDRLSLSVGGNALSSQNFEFPNVNNETYNIENQNLNLRPMHATAVYPTRWGTAGLFVAVPSSADIIYSSSRRDQVNNLNMDVLVRSGTQTLMVGTGLASKLNSQLAWGISAGLRQEESSNHSQYTYTGVGTGMGYAEFSEKKLKLFLSPGILVKPNEYWTIGFAAHILPLNLSSMGKTFSNSMSSGAPNTITTSSKNYDPSTSEIPYSLRLGNSIKVSSNQVLSYDVVFSSSESSRSDSGKISTKDSYFSHSVGYSKKLSDSWETLFGFLYSETESSKNHLSTAGILYVNRRNEFILGPFYLESNPKSSKEGDTVYGSSKVYGIMFSSSVAY